MRAGDETTGIDIRYRADQGYAISGTLSGTALSSTKSPMALIYLMHQSTGSMVSNTVVQVRDGARGFALTGVPDGEYDLVAQLNQTAGEDNVASLPRRVTVKGADVTGLSVELAPLGSITGRVVIEKLSESSAVAECKERVGGTLDETLISARRDEPPGKALAPFGFPSPEAGIDQSGEFKISSLTPARYRIGTRLPSEHWYVRTILGPGAGTKPSTAVSSQGISLSSGQRVTGLVVTIAEGAAAVRGKVTQPSANSPLPERVRIYLVPAEPESADDLLRYAEADVEASGVYLFTNIAPGKYYVLAREPAGEQITERNARPLAWDAAARVSLRQQATSVNQVIELGQCQRIVDREVRFTQSPGGTQRPRRPRPPS